MIERCFRDAVGAPSRVRRDCGIRADVHDDSRPAQRHRAGDHAGEPEGADQIRLHHGREIFAFRIEQEPQRRRP